MISSYLPKTGKETLVVSSLAFGLGGLFVWWCRQRRVEPWKRVGVVEKLYIFPLKSGQPHLIDEAFFDQCGVKTSEWEDRSFMIVDSSTLTYFSSRSNPRTVLVTLHSEGYQMRLTAPDMHDLVFTMPEETKIQESVKLHDININNVIDCGEDVAKWLSKFLVNADQGVRLVYTKGDPHPNKRPIRPKWSSLFPQMKQSQSIPIFSDITPYMMLSRASIQDIDNKVKEVDGKVMDEVRFRPNVVVKTEENKPYEEDSWTGDVLIGDPSTGPILRYAQPCIRCLSVQVDPESGELDRIQESKGPMKTLKTFRQVEKDKKAIRQHIADSPKFGVHFGTIRTGHVKVGDVVYVRQI